MNVSPSRFWETASMTTDQYFVYSVFVARSRGVYLSGMQSGRILPKGQRCDIGLPYYFIQSNQYKRREAKSNKKKKRELNTLYVIG